MYGEGSIACCLLRVQVNTKTLNPTSPLPFLFCSDEHQAGHINQSDYVEGTQWTVG